MMRDAGPRRQGSQRLVVKPQNTKVKEKVFKAVRTEGGSPADAVSSRGHTGWEPVLDFPPVQRKCRSLISYDGEGDDKGNIYICIKLTHFAVFLVQCTSTIFQFFF